MIQPRWFQNAAYDAVIEALNAGVRSLLIALPTGTGKSVVVGLICQRLLMQWPSLRFMMLTHVKELIAQNYARLLEMWPAAPVGIFSAGLKRRDTALPIIFGVDGYVVGNVPAFGPRDVLIIDEAHLLSGADASEYQKIISMLRAINPSLVVIGLTATKYRTGQGLLTENGIFDKCVYDLTDIQGFNRLLAEGYLAPLYPKRTYTEYDLNGVARGHDGDYAKGALQKAIDKQELTENILAECCEYARDRHSWLFFAAGVEHADHVAESLKTRFNVNAAAVHSKMPSKDRDARLKAFKSGELRALVSNNVCTTGFDHPPTDFIGMLRPTTSTGLHVQMNGRGTRPSPGTGKRDCLVLDFAGNTRRLGPINDPVIPRPKGAGGGGEMPIRICESCGVYNHASARVCMACGAEFLMSSRLLQTADTAELIRSDAPIIETFEVLRVFYAHHDKHIAGKLPTMRVSYACRGSLNAFTEYIGFDHGGLFGKKARDWWRQRHGTEPPTPDNCAPYPTATLAALSATSQFRVPARIRVHVNTKHPEIVGVEYD